MVSSSSLGQAGGSREVSASKPTPASSGAEATVAPVSRSKTFTTAASSNRPMPAAEVSRNCWWAVEATGSGNLRPRASSSTIPRSLTKMSTALWGVKSSSSMCGTRLLNIQLAPAALLMMSYSMRVLSPARAPRAIASAAVAMWAPASSWFTIFTEDPSPAPPTLYSRSLRSSSR